MNFIGPGGNAHRTLMKLANRLLLIVGHTLGDLALPLMKRQCERIGASMESLTPDDAERLMVPLERVLDGFVSRRKDLEAIMHELKVEIGTERFSEYAPPRARAGPAMGRSAALQPPGG